MIMISLMIILPSCISLGVGAFESFGSELSNSKSPYDIWGKTVITEKYPEPRNDVRYGEGYNSINFQKTYNKAVYVKKSSLKKRDIALRSEINIEFYNTKEDLTRAIDGGLSGSASFLGVNTNVSAVILSGLNMTSLDTVLLVSVDIDTSIKEVDEMILKDDPKALLNNEEYDEFVGKYGTHYLKKYTEGGKMRIAIKFSSKSIDDNTKFYGNVSSNFIGYGQGDAKLDYSSNSKLSNTTKSISTYVVGGDLDIPTSENVEDYIALAKKFKDSVKDHPVVKELQYVAIWSIPEVQQGFKNHVLNLQKSTDALLGISTDLLDTQSRVNDLIALRYTEKIDLNETEWEIITTIGRKTKELYRLLQSEYIMSTFAKYSDIVKTFDNKTPSLNEKIDEIVNRKRDFKFNFTKGKVYLKNKAYDKYISYDSDTGDKWFPILDVGIKSTTFKISIITDESTKDSYNNQYYIYEHTKGWLCMIKNKWWTRWGTEYEKDDDGCLWRLYDSKLSRRLKDFVDVKDNAVIIRNVRWSDYIVTPGLYGGKQYLYDTVHNTNGNENNEYLWSIEKDDYNA